MRSFPLLSWRRADVSVFDGVAAFAGYDHRALAPLARHADRLALTPGTTVAHEGHRTNEVVIVLAGELRAHLGGIEVGTLGAGTVVGASEELAGTPHEHTVVAADGVEVLTLTGPAYRWAARTLADFAVRTLAGQAATAPRLRDRHPQVAA